MATFVNTQRGHVPAMITAHQLLAGEGSWLPAVVKGCGSGKKSLGPLLSISVQPLTFVISDKWGRVGGHLSRERGHKASSGPRRHELDHLAFSRPVDPLLWRRNYTI